MSEIDPEMEGQQEETAKRFGLEGESGEVSGGAAPAPDVTENATARGDTPQESAAMVAAAAPAALPNVAQEREAEVSPSVEGLMPAAAHFAPDEGSHAVSGDLYDAVIERQMHHMSRRSFLWGAVAVAAGFGGLHWLDSRPTSDGIVWPLRRMLEFNEGLARGYFKDSRLAPTFARAQAREPRPNGDIGLPSDVDVDSWKLHVIGLADTAKARMVTIPIPAVVDSDDITPLPTKQELALTLDLAAIQALPRIEMVTELKCIEGWSVVVQWAGARFADFAAAYAPKMENGVAPHYVGIQTPDGKYFVGLEMASALHPQTLLCYEMNGAPLTDDHGAPLRLVTPVKYGIKHIKRIGAIRFTNERPIDYWAVLGYDWYAGH